MNKILYIVTPWHASQAMWVIQSWGITNVHPNVYIKFLNDPQDIRDCPKGGAAWISYEASHQLTRMAKEQFGPSVTELLIGEWWAAFNSPSRGHAGPRDGHRAGQGT